MGKLSKWAKSQKWQNLENGKISKWQNFKNGKSQNDQSKKSYQEKS